MRRIVIFALVPVLALAWLAVSPRLASRGEMLYARMTTAMHAIAEPGRERSTIETNSAGMTFAIALRGTALDVEFPFPGPAAPHRYRFAVDRRSARAWAERIDARGRVVAGPIRGHANTLFPLTAPEVFRFLAVYAGASKNAPYAAQAYTITDLGTERQAGHRVDHLHLVARADRATRPLTDIDVDATTGLPRRIWADIVSPATPALHARFVFDLDGTPRRWTVRAAHVEARLRLGPGVTRSGHVDVIVDDVMLAD